MDLLLLSMQMLFPFVPFALLAGMNVILFGWFWGFLLSLTASVLGSSLGFYLARFLGQEWAKPRIVKLGKWASLSSEKNFVIIMLSRIIPILPAAAVNYAIGLSPVPFRVFLLATIIGKIPMIAWESWIGHDFWLILHHPLRFLGAMSVGIIFIGIGIVIWRQSNQPTKSDE